MQAVNQLEEKLKSGDVDFELYRYAGVGHAFMNDTPVGIERRKRLGQGDHDQKAVDAAWERVFAFLEKHID